MEKETNSMTNKQWQCFLRLILDKLKVIADSENQSEKLKDLIDIVQQMLEDA